MLFIRAMVLYHCTHNHSLFVYYLSSKTSNIMIQIHIVNMKMNMKLNIIIHMDIVMVIANNNLTMDK